MQHGMNRDEAPYGARHARHALFVWSRELQESLASRIRLRKCSWPGAHLAYAPRKMRDRSLKVTHLQCQTQRNEDVACNTHKDAPATARALSPRRIER